MLTSSQKHVGKHTVRDQSLGAGRQLACWWGLDGLGACIALSLLPQAHRRLLRRRLGLCCRFRGCFVDLGHELSTQSCLSAEIVAHLASVQGRTAPVARAAVLGKPIRAIQVNLPSPLPASPSSYPQPVFKYPTQHLDYQLRPQFLPTLIFQHSTSISRP
ncbi:hypothetical protein JAAARDRAFT_62055 [Jaapia argillacea MUCL 33604]|uniref:Uncharacterized protein n=1 Tax=Jaapia argillacea MUCL 33604 TaxID=933084 RepID=A0A067PC15_9AGAM|nr:hypothetical protein JAAARDRAFT_62055 [Jaapia argillacea MUCL 33604]